MTSRVAMPLANDGYFFAVASTIGVRDEEVDEPDKIPAERQACIKTNTEEAMLALARAETMGKC